MTLNELKERVDELIGQGHGNLEIEMTDYSRYFDGYAKRLILNVDEDEPYIEITSSEEYSDNDSDSNEPTDEELDDEDEN